MGRSSLGPGVRFSGKRECKTLGAVVHICFQTPVFQNQIKPKCFRHPSELVLVAASGQQQEAMPMTHRGSWFGGEGDLQGMKLKLRSLFR